MPKVQVVDSQLGGSTAPKGVLKTFQGEEHDYTNF
jgi:hypothetical protein